MSVGGTYLFNQLPLQHFHITCKSITHANNRTWMANKYCLHVRLKDVSPAVGDMDMLAINNKPFVYINLSNRVTSTQPIAKNAIVLPKDTCKTQIYFAMNFRSFLQKVSHIYSKDHLFSIVFNLLLEHLHLFAKISDFSRPFHLHITMQTLHHIQYKRSIH